jgi:hypothetical protein
MDSVFLSFIILSALLHALSRGHHDTEDRPAIAPFAWHSLHAAVGLCGFVSIIIPAAQTPSQTLVWLAPLAAVGDILAISVQVRYSLIDQSMLNEYTIFAILATTLAFSAVNVYWAACRERATFSTTVHVVDEGGFGSRHRRRQ